MSFITTDFCTNPFVILAFTSFFVFLPRIVKNDLISNFTKCLTGGIMLAIMILHVIDDLYENQDEKMRPIASGFSFLILFAIDKFFLNEEDKDSVPVNSTKLQALIFVFGLSVHSFFEGFSIPFKKGTSKFYYALSLLGHKWIEAFSLGVSVESTNFGIQFKTLLLFIYSCLTPVGILISTLIKNTNSSHYQSYSKDLLIGLSTGSFFYVGFIDMLNSEVKSTDSTKMKAKKIFIIFAGYIGMTSLLYFIDNHFK